MGWPDGLPLRELLVASEEVVTGGCFREFSSYW